MPKSDARSEVIRHDLARTLPSEELFREKDGAFRVDWSGVFLGRCGLAGRCVYLRRGEGELCSCGMLREVVIWLPGFHSLPCECQDSWSDNCLASIDLPDVAQVLHRVASDRGSQQTHIKWTN